MIDILYSRIQYEDMDDCAGFGIVTELWYGLELELVINLEVK